MREGRPSKYRETYCDLVVEDDAEAVDTRRLAEPMPFSDEMVDYKKWRGVPEPEWCRFAVGRHHEWIAVTGKETFDKVEYEVSLTPGGRSRRVGGSSRADAVGWRNGRATIIETKVKPYPTSMMDGVGQLLYYKTVATKILGWDVEDLILLTPTWANLVLETVAESNLPITLVKANADGFLCRRYTGNPIRA